jgi:hypothetical protein
MMKLQMEQNNNLCKLQIVVLFNSIWKCKLQNVVLIINSIWNYNKHRLERCDQVPSGISFALSETELYKRSIWKNEHICSRWKKFRLERNVSCFKLIIPNGSKPHAFHHRRAMSLPAENKKRWRSCRLFHLDIIK